MILELFKYAGLFLVWTMVLLFYFIAGIVLIAVLQNQTIDDPDDLNVFLVLIWPVVVVWWGLKGLIRLAKGDGNGKEAR